MILVALLLRLRPMPVKAVRLRTPHAIGWVLLLMAILLTTALPASGENTTVTYLENSDHEVTIYFINGKEPGNTLMIIGGIQGDEPGGYLAADLYADMRLDKGNLIVVPRANYNSIRKNARGVNGDMNRMFRLENADSSASEQYVVEILKSLISKSDVLLNLHEGSGFYSPTYISDQRNPMRFGQSIIADAASYLRPDSTVIDLAGIAGRIIGRVNGNIRNESHRFAFNNHDTLKSTTLHPEQRTSATYYSLTEEHIPAFGVETSKSISSVEMKVRYETLVINAFMDEFGIIPEQPSVFLPTPALDHLVVQVIGNSTPFAVKNGDTLTVPMGSAIHVTDIVANYKRGLSLDIVGQANANDLGRVTTVKGSTTINVYKDSYLCGKVTIAVEKPDAVSSRKGPIASSGDRLGQVVVEVGRKNMVVSAGDTLHIVRGDSIILKDALDNKGNRAAYRLNFVGFVGKRSYNDAEDRGYPVNTQADLMERFSLDGKGRIYQVKAEDMAAGTLLMGSIFIVLDEPRVEYMIVERPDGVRRALAPGEDVYCVAGDKYRVISIVTNVTALPGVEVSTVRDGRPIERLDLPATLDISSRFTIQFRRAGVALGTIAFRIDG